MQYASRSFFCFSNSPRILLPLTAGIATTLPQHHCCSPRIIAIAFSNWSSYFHSCPVAIILNMAANVILLILIKLSLLYSKPLMVLNFNQTKNQSSQNPRLFSSTSLLDLITNSLSFNPNTAVIVASMLFLEHSRHIPALVSSHPLFPCNETLLL